MKFTAVGDMLIQQRIYEEYEGFAELTPFIREGDARFFNLETTLNHEGETCASQFSGGTYIRTNPEVLDDLKGFGFNMTNINNNHMLDFSYGGLEKTMEAVNQSGLVHAGVGRNLAEASAPRYLETKNGRVALISVSTSFKDPMLAGEQSPRVTGRPGVNGLRKEKHLELPKKDLEIIRRIASETGINAEMEIYRKEGYYAEVPENEAVLGDLRFLEGDTPKYVIRLNESDIQRVEKAIYEAKLQADYIMVSVHSHEISGDKKENPSEFLVDLAHRCIDAGAHAIVGHGPHLLRPIEVYKDCPIFYSLGDFILQLYSIEFAPEDFFQKHGMDSSYTVHDLLKKRSKNFTTGLMEDPRMYRTVIASWETEGTKLKKITLMPVEMKMDGHRSEQGLPRKCDSEKIFDYLNDMCKPYGTTIVREENGLLSCVW